MSTTNLENKLDTLEALKLLIHMFCYKILIIQNAISKTNQCNSNTHFENKKHCYFRGNMRSALYREKVSELFKAMKV